MDANYATFGGAVPPTAFAGVDTSKASCAGATYELHVLDTAGNPIADPDVEIGDGSRTHFDLSSVPSGGPSEVCISVESRSATGRVIDQAPDAPDAACARGAHFTLDGGTGGRPMG